MEVSNTPSPAAVPASRKNKRQQGGSNKAKKKLKMTNNSSPNKHSYAKDSVNRVAAMQQVKGLSQAAKLRMEIATLQVCYRSDNPMCVYVSI
jgi:hypothetical protein